MSDELTVSLMPEPPFHRATSTAAGGVPRISGPEAGLENTSLDQERREVLASVLETLSGNPSDPDEMAACRHLLKRLAETAGRPGRHSA